MAYRAVVFDLFGTLVPTFPPELFERSLAGMAEAIAVDRQAFRRAWVEDTSRARMTGVFPTVEANILHIARALGAAPTEAEVARAVRIRREFYRATIEPRPDAVQTLRALKAMGIRLGLVSDCSYEAPQLWPESPFAALIDYPVFSCRAGLKKPDPGLYRLACQGLGVEPGECIYVADGYSHELASAQALGMHAVLIAVPGEVPFSYGMAEAATWRGPRVASLTEVVGIAGDPLTRPGS